jgi:hypothetical protein
MERENCKIMNKVAVSCFKVLYVQLKRLNETKRKADPSIRATRTHNQTQYLMIVESLPRKLAEQIIGTPPPFGKGGDVKFVFGLVCN